MTKKQNPIDFLGFEPKAGEVFLCACGQYHSTKTHNGYLGGMAMSKRCGYYRTLIDRQKKAWRDAVDTCYDLKERAPFRDWLNLIYEKAIPPAIRPLVLINSEEPVGQVSVFTISNKMWVKLQINKNSYYFALGNKAVLRWNVKLMKRGIKLGPAYPEEIAILRKLIPYRTYKSQ